VNKFNSIFGQILQVFDKLVFMESIRDTKAERSAKGFTRWEKFVDMLFCQLGQAHSLRMFPFQLFAVRDISCYTVCTKQATRPSIHYFSMTSR